MIHFCVCVLGIRVIWRNRYICTVKEYTRQLEMELCLFCRRVCYCVLYICRRNRVEREHQFAWLNIKCIADWMMEIDFDSSTCAWQLVSTFGRLWRRLLWLRNEKKKKKKKKKKLFTFCCITIFTEFEPPHRLMIQPLSLSSFNQVLPYFCLLLPTWCVIGVSLPCFFPST